MGVEAIIALVVAGLLLVFCEVFVPGGVLGMIGGALMLIGIVAGFIKSVNLGFLLLICSLVFGLIGFYLWIKFFPRSRMGKKLILENDAQDWHGFDVLHEELTGKEGLAHSSLRPAGVAIIEGKRVDVVTRGEMIDAGSPIRVIEVEGNRVVVTTV